MTTPIAAELQARARALRQLAATVERSALRHLLAAGGDDTWRGPTAWAFQDDARRINRLVDETVDALYHAARTLEAAVP
jgi:uncharacterized protein YukE